MPTLSQVRTYVNGKLDDLWNLADARQQTYAAEHGRYWQGRVTRRIDLLPNTLPGDAATQEYPLDDDDTIGIAGSHEIGWKAALPQIPATLPAAFQADEWKSPAGIGWSLQVWIKFDGVTYARKRSRLEDGSIVTSAWKVAP